MKGADSVATLAVALGEKVLQSMMFPAATTVFLGWGKGNAIGDVADLVEGGNDIHKFCEIFFRLRQGPCPGDFRGARAGALAQSGGYLWVGTTALLRSSGTSQLRTGRPPLPLPSLLIRELSACRRNFLARALPHRHPPERFAQDTGEFFYLRRRGRFIFGKNVIVGD